VLQKNLLDGLSSKSYLLSILQKQHPKYSANIHFWFTMNVMYSIMSSFVLPKVDFICDTMGSWAWI